MADNPAIQTLVQALLDEDTQALQVHSSQGYMTGCSSLKRRCCPVCVQMGKARVSVRAMLKEAQEEARRQNAERKPTAKKKGINR